MIFVAGKEGSTSSSSSNTANQQRVKQRFVGGQERYDQRFVSAQR